jgi:NADPH:quinone reductase
MRAILRTGFGGPDVLVIRGATSAFGLAALNMAVTAEARVIGTTRSRGQFPLLEALGAVRAEVEGPDLSRQIAEARKIDAVLDLVGNSTILDSLAMLRRGGRACLAGWLGGLAPIADFNPLLQMASGVYLTFFGSFVFGSVLWRQSAPLPVRLVICVTA